MRKRAITVVSILALGVAEPALAADQPRPTDQPPVVVTGQRPVLHKCAARDEACIKAVIERIWTENRKEVEAWCLQEGMRLAGQRWQMRALLGDGAIGPYNQDMPEAERQLCDYGRTHPAR